MPPSLPTTKNVVALSFMEQCRCSCYQRRLLQHSTRDKSHAMTGESVITGLSLWLKADGSISPPLQNPRVHISQQTAHCHSTVLFCLFVLFFNTIEKVMKADESSSHAASSEYVPMSLESLITFSPHHNRILVSSMYIIELIKMQTIQRLTTPEFQ